MRTQDNNVQVSTKSHSKLDLTGTDPNRYENYYSPEKAEYLSVEKSDPKSIVPGLETNISTIERLIMVAAGTYILYKALSGKNKSITQGIMGGTMLARGVSGYCPVYDLAHQNGKLKSANVNIRTTININKPVNEVYDFWRNLENLPKFMKHLESVTEKDKITSDWKARGPAGIGSLSWTAQILMDEKDRMLSWHSLPDSTIDNAGKVYFKDNGDNSTELDVTISYHAPLGVAGEAAAKLLNPLFSKMVTHDIENLKTYLETGENNIDK